MDNTLKDLAKVGTMLVVSRLFAGENLQGQAWQRASLFTLLGFTAYNLLTQYFLNTEQFGTYKAIADDWLKVGTMLVVSRLLSGQPLDQAWQRATLYTLLGFTAYQLFTKNFVKGADVSGVPEIQATVNDWAKAGTMLAVSHLLGGGSLQDRAWQRASLGTLLGFTAYNLFVKNLLGQ